MHTILRTLWLLLALVSSPGLLAAAPSATTAPAGVGSEYTITVIPFYGPEKIWALYTPFVNFLRESTGKPWTLKLYPTHEALTTGLCRGEVSLALLGPVPLAKVMARCQAEPLVVALGKDGTPTYRSFIVSTDPQVTTLEGLKGRRFGFFKGSTAAHILPRQLLRQAGLNQTDLVPVFFEGQDHIVNALLRRQVAAAGLKEALFRKFQDEGFRVLATSDPVPNFTFAAGPNVNVASRELFSETLLRLAPASNLADRTRMATWDDEIKNGFIPPTATFRGAVKDLLAITEEIMREDR